MGIIERQISLSLSIYLFIYLSISVSNSYDDLLINKALIEISDCSWYFVKEEEFRKTKKIRR